jgi:hypothetical protein
MEHVLTGKSHVFDHPIPLSNAVSDVHPQVFLANSPHVYHLIHIYMANLTLK